MIAAEAELPPADLSDWRGLIGQLKLGGMARMLADHCELQRADGSLLELAVPKAHSHLIVKAYSDKLQTALEERLGRKVRLKIAVGGNGRTPAAEEDQERQQRLDRAVAAIDTDPFVQELVEGFDARVIDSSIKPAQ